MRGSVEGIEEAKGKGAGKEDEMEEGNRRRDGNGDIDGRSKGGKRERMK